MKPPTKLPEVVYPFQHVCADYFSLKGLVYLVIIDRYSGRPIVHQARKAGVLVKIFQELCTTFGVPEELASDGGLKFVTEEVKNFCLVWGIRQRNSSAYFPH